MESRRRQILLVVLGLDALVCGAWAYWVAASMLRSLRAAGSGGFASVSVGAGLFESLSTILPPIATMLLARASGSTSFARYWRNAHLVALLGLIVLPMIGGLRLMMVSIAVFLPVQVFFVIGAFAIWIASRRTRPDVPGEAS